MSEDSGTGTTGTEATQGQQLQPGLMTPGGVGQFGGMGFVSGGAHGVQLNGTGAVLSQEDQPKTAESAANLAVGNILVDAGIRHSTGEFIVKKSPSLTSDDIAGAGFMAVNMEVERRSNEAMDLASSLGAAPPPPTMTSKDLIDWRAQRELANAQTMQQEQDNNGPARTLVGPGI